jgi:mannonate dehydratase
MRQSWRWFGPKDPITLREIRQAGATDIVTALHHVPCGELWTEAEIKQHQDLVAWDAQRNKPTGLTWTVVESLPIHESIKTRSGPFRHHLEIYKQSLANLGKAGLKVICYNFMPILDWTRTDLRRELEDGSTVLFCDMDSLAAFDLFILKRAKAEADYSAEELKRAKERFDSLDEAGRKKMADSILLGLPGTVDDLTVEDLAAKLATYEGIDDARLRENYYSFLDEIMPICDELGIRMAIHPDDPPKPILGLPRILSTSADVDQLFARIPSRNCGLTLCTGSFGGRQDNAPAEMFERFAPRVHFAHLRNTQFLKDGTGSFHESSHLSGHVDMPRAMTALIREEARRKAAGLEDWRIPVRPDHGKLMDWDLGRNCYAGYSYGGRAIGLAELRGLELGLRSALGIPAE